MTSPPWPVSSGVVTVFSDGQVLRHVAETQRSVRRDVREKAGLTLYDVFFTETSRVNQVCACV
jgi:hypothetical protein